jgi:outer membrane protein/protease secretion system outer membrane protein
MDLVESYDLARENDPDLAAARASADAAKEAGPIALSQLLPNVTASASFFDNRLDTSTKTTSRYDEYPSQSMALTLRQPIFRPSLIYGYKQAQAQVRGVKSELMGAEQDAILRLAAAYFDVSQARFELSAIETQMDALTIQLQGAKVSLSVGIGIRTDVDDIQARLDLAAARKLQAEQRLELVGLALHNLTGSDNSDTLDLSPDRMRLEAIGDATFEDWLDKAREHNPTLAAAHERVKVAENGSKAVTWSRLPTVDGIVQRVKSKSDNVTNPDYQFTNKQFGIQITVPLYQGGYISAKERQSFAQLREAQAQEMSVERKLSASVRESFSAVQAGILRVRALEAAQKSADQAVYSNGKAIQAGTRSKIELLNAIQSKAETAMELNRARIAFVLARLKLLALSGSLEETDLIEVNSWLAK